MCSICGDHGAEVAEMIGSLLAKREELPSLLVVALEAVQVVVGGLAFVCSLPSSDQTEFETLSNSKAGPANVTRQLLLQSSYWSGACKQARQQAVACKTLLPEIQGIEGRLQKGDVPLSEFVSVARRMVVWTEALRPGQGLHVIRNVKFSHY